MSLKLFNSTSSTLKHFLGVVFSATKTNLTYRDQPIWQITAEHIIAPVVTKYESLILKYGDRCQTMIELFNRAIRNIRSMHFGQFLEYQKHITLLIIKLTLNGPWRGVLISTSRRGTNSLLNNSKESWCGAFGSDLQMPVRSTLNKPGHHSVTVRL